MSKLWLSKGQLSRDGRPRIAKQVQKWTRDKHNGLNDTIRFLRARSNNNRDQSFEYPLKLK